MSIIGAFVLRLAVAAARRHERLHCERMTPNEFADGWQARVDLCRAADDLEAS